MKFLIIISLSLVLLLIPIKQERPRRTPHVAGGGGSAPTFDAATTSSSASFSHTVSGSNRLLIVAISNDASNAFNPSAVLDGVTSMTTLTFADNPTDGAFNRISVFYLINPPTGSNSITFSIGPANFVAIAISYNGVNQTTPFGTAVTGNGSNASQPSVTVSSGTSELTFDAISTLNSNSDTFTPGAGQTKRASIDAAASIGAAVSDKAGAASVVMTWSSPTRYWAQVGVSIKP